MRDGFATADAFHPPATREAAGRLDAPVLMYAGELDASLGRRDGPGCAGNPGPFGIMERVRAERGGLSRPAPADRIPQDIAWSG